VAGEVTVTWGDMDHPKVVAVELAINATDRGVAEVDLVIDIEETTTPTEEEAAEEETIIMLQKRRGVAEIGARIAITTTGAVERGTTTTTTTKLKTTIDNTGYQVLNESKAIESLPAIHLCNYPIT
jgi:hypothetical protein